MPPIGSFGDLWACLPARYHDCLFCRFSGLFFRLSSMPLFHCCLLGLRLSPTTVSRLSPMSVENVLSPATARNLFPAFLAWLYIARPKTDNFFTPVYSPNIQSCKLHYLMLALCNKVIYSIPINNETYKPRHYQMAL